MRVEHERGQRAPVLQAWRLRRHGAGSVVPRASLFGAFSVFAYTLSTLFHLHWQLEPPMCFFQVHASSHALSPTRAPVCISSCLPDNRLHLEIWWNLQFNLQKEDPCLPLANLLHYNSVKGTTIHPDAQFLCLELHVDSPPFFLHPVNHLVLAGQPTKYTQELFSSPLLCGCYPFWPL